MGFVLVLAGNHAQYMGWLSNVYGAGGRVGGAPRHLNHLGKLWGVRADDVDALHQVGTYWENPVWGSDLYADLMRQGCELGKAWAMTPETDWVMACMLRDPVTPEQFRTARQRLVALVGELADDD